MREPAVGIDLGTTFSVIAYVDQDGKPRTIANAEGDLTTPSVVLVDEETVIVGKEAIKAATIEPDLVADFAKRDMGNELYHRTVSGNQYPPQVLMSFVLEKLKRDAERVIGPFSKAVVTVPAFFNDTRRKATLEAAALANIEVLELINEPTAAALVQGIRSGFLSTTGLADKDETVMVYDLGGGTFDVTIMQIRADRFRTISSDGEMLLGGDDWDQRIVEWIAEQFSEQNRGLDPLADARGRSRLKKEAEDAKRTLSTMSKARIMVEHAGSSVSAVLQRSEFEEMTADLLDRTQRAMERAKRAAAVKLNYPNPNAVSWTDLITRILLVGGSTRMPAVSQMIKKETGIEPDQSLSADEAVAHGAAIYASLLQQGKKTRYVENVSTHSIGILAKDSEGIKRNQIVIPRNSSLPAEFTRRFRMPASGNVVMTVLEGEAANPRHCTVLHKHPVTPRQKISDRSPVAVTLGLTPDGCVRGEVHFLESNERISLFKRKKSVR